MKDKKPTSQERKENEVGLLESSSWLLRNSEKVKFGFPSGIVKHLKILGFLTVWFTIPVVLMAFLTSSPAVRPAPQMYPLVTDQKGGPSASPIILTSPISEPTVEPIFFFPEIKDASPSASIQPSESPTGLVLPKKEPIWRGFDFWKKVGLIAGGLFVLILLISGLSRGRRISKLPEQESLPEEEKVEPKPEQEPPPPSQTEIKPPNQQWPPQ